MKSSRGVPLLLLVSILTILFIPQSSFGIIHPNPSDLNVGPYVDDVVFKVIPNSDHRILAIQAGEVEMDSSFTDIWLLDWFGDPDIDIFSALRNGYGDITINCEKYPLNISGFRRAFAYAFDKTAVTVDIMDGFSQEHDSLVPYTNGWCIEDEFDWHYYFDRSDIGNQILEDLGFEIDPTSGFRLAPNGEPFKIQIEYSSISREIAGGVAQIGVDALRRLNVDAEAIPVDINDYKNRLDMHEDYDMVFSSRDFDNNDVVWLAYEFWSEYTDVEYQNPSNFRNATYDEWRNQLLYGSTYEEVYEAAAEMQKILHYNVPRLVVYENTYMQMYRSDIYTGYVEDLGRYISGPWTMRKIHNIDGSYGGTVPVAIATELDSFNYFVTESSFSSRSVSMILDNLYSSLFQYGPDLSPWPDLAEHILTETHSDNPSVIEGHTRFTIDIIQNATWSDGIPLTAEDVAFTFTYQYESAGFGNPAGNDMEDLFAIYCPTPYRVVLEYTTESYWHFSKFAYDYIIPRHIFYGDPGIGPDEWNTWNPVFNPADPFITSGPYLFSDYESGEYFRIVWNPRYHYRVENRISLLKPIILHVSDIVYVYGTLGNEITWVIDDEDSVSYEIRMNGTTCMSGLVTSNNITYNIDNLIPGHYTFTLSVTDGLGNIGTSTTEVYVLISPFHGTDGSINLSTVVSVSISGGSMVIILFAIVSIYKNEKYDPYSKQRDAFYNFKEHCRSRFLTIEDTNTKI